MTRYPRLLMAIHWLTAALIVFAWFSGDWRDAARHHSPEAIHGMAGLAVLALFVPRLLVRLFGGTPADPPGTSRAMVIAAKAGHGLLYLFIIFLPLMGWYAGSLKGMDLQFFGLTVPPLATMTDGKAGFIGDAHEVGGNVLMVLAGGHALMALYHQYFLRDGTLMRMLPWGGK